MLSKNTFPNKRENPEILKKRFPTETSSTNVHIAGEDLMRAFYKFFVYGFLIQVIKWQNTLCSKDFKRNLTATFFIKKDRKYNPNKLTCKFAFIPFLPFHRN